jgi:hypothetical protein
MFDWLAKVWRGWGYANNAMALAGLVFGWRAWLPGFAGPAATIIWATGGKVLNYVEGQICRASKKPQLYQHKPLTESVSITKSWGERLALLSVKEYQQLKRGDRRVGLISELADEWLGTVSKGRMEPEPKKTQWFDQAQFYNPAAIVSSRHDRNEP